MLNDFKIVFYWHLADRDNFGVQLFKLIGKADSENMVRLSQGFPDHVKLFQQWMGTPNPPSESKLESFAEELGIEFESEE